MAKATPVDGIQNTRTLKLAHTAAVEAHDIIVSGGNVLVAVSDAAADEENVYMFDGKFLFPKGSGAISSAVYAYWDSSAGEATTVATDNTRSGIFAEKADTSDTEVLVMLKAN